MPDMHNNSAAKLLNAFFWCIRGSATHHECALGLAAQRLAGIAPLAR